MPQSSLETLKRCLESYLQAKIVATKEGTYGVVFIAELGGTTTPRHVAYKTIHPERADPDPNSKVNTNFVREANIWLRMKGHGFILTPLFIVTPDDLPPLIAMPFCDRDLETYLEARPPGDVTEALVFITYILHALRIARQRGMDYHQDLKPANILLEDVTVHRFLAQLRGAVVHRLAA